MSKVFIVMRQINSDCGVEFKNHVVCSSKEKANQELVKLQKEISEVEALWNEGQAKYKKALEERGLKRYGLVTQEMNTLYKEAMKEYHSHPNRHLAHDYTPVIEEHELL